MSIPLSRILDLTKTQCRIFSQIYNPERLRLGNKILRQRLRGPSIASYYPPRAAKWGQLRKAYEKMGAMLINEDEEERLQKLDELRQRGKGQWQHRRGTMGTAVRRK